MYNGASFICDYVESLKSQRFTDWETIVIDDESTDSSVDILLDLTRNDPRFTLVSPARSSSDTSPKGPFKPRNEGLSLANGKYICYLDIDDYWLPNKLNDQYDCLSANPALMLLYGNYYKVDSSLARGYLKPRIDIIPVKLQVFFWNPIPNLTSCINANVAKSHEFMPIPHEDYIYWFYILKQLDQSQIASISSPQALYRCSSSSVSRNKIKVLGWWLQCYSLIGYSKPLSLILLLQKLASELIEYLLSRANVFMSYPSSVFRS
jgi:glycosyltransferase involved in cell wall biosynthesis